MFGVVMKTEKLFYQFMSAVLVIFSLQVNAQSKWYVNNLIGSDDYDGLSETLAAPTSGPKKTIANTIFEANSQDTIIIVNTGIDYGSTTSEPDTIIITKDLVFESSGGVISISSNLEINFSDSLNSSEDIVEINSPFNLQGNLTIYNSLQLNESFNLLGNLTIGSNPSLPDTDRKLCFNSPLVFIGDDNQVISVPQEGAYIGSFEINKPNGNVILEGGNLDLSESYDSTFNNVVIFTKGLFITGNNKLILKAPAGTDELGFVHQPAVGDVSHVVGTVGIEPKLDPIKENSKTSWPVGSVEFYRPFSMLILNTSVTNLGEVILATHIDEKPSDANGLPIESEGGSYTYFPDFHWLIVTENNNPLSSLMYDLEFAAEGFTDFANVDEVIGIFQFVPYSGERIWFQMNGDYENTITDNLPLIKCMYTRGVFQRVPTIVTFGLPTKLYTTGTLPDLGFSCEKVLIDIDGLFGGNEGELKYYCTSSDTDIVYVSGGEFSETTFEIEGLSDGNAEISITALDVNGDFLKTSFKVFVDYCDGYYDAIESQLGIPVNYELTQNYPNPFNPTTTIRFGLPEASRVSLKIYNTLGEEVSSVVENMDLQAGYHAYNFDAGNLTSGVYFYKIEANDFYEVRKMILIK